MAQRHGVGVVGAGVIFMEHAQAYQNLKERVVIRAIADIDERKLRQATDRHFIPIALSDYNDLLTRDDIDVIDVCTPAGLPRGGDHCGAEGR